MRVLILAATVLLAACDQSPKPDDRICLTAPTEIATGDMKACVHKWAYRLARSSDPAKVVAEAVVDACNDVANYRADGSPLENTEEGKRQYEAALAEAETNALFRVVQARAGHCEIL